MFPYGGLYIEVVLEGKISFWNTKIETVSAHQKENPGLYQKRPSNWVQWPVQFFFMYLASMRVHFHYEIKNILSERFSNYGSSMMPDVHPRLCLIALAVFQCARQTWSGKTLRVFPLPGTLIDPSAVQLCMHLLSLQWYDGVVVLPC